MTDFKNSFNWEHEKATELRNYPEDITIWKGKDPLMLAFKPVLDRTTTDVKLSKKYY